MKKTYNINLNSQIFCIDEDAFIRLKNYIEILEKHYLNEEDGSEIMADIESRIAELFSQFLQKSHLEVISQAHIDEIIKVMGTPDAIIDEDSEYATTSSIKRKLYRDTDHMVLGGVASGLAAYFSISTIVVRLLFILLGFLYGITILIYIILWIVMPAAITSRQKLEMKGKKINVSNIEKNIRHTYSKVKNNNKFSKVLDYTNQKISNIFTTLGEFFHNTLIIIAHILAVIGVVIGIFSFLIVCWGILFSFHLLPEKYHLILQYICAPIPLWTVKFVLLCFINIPIALIVYYAIIYLFKFKGKKGFLITTGLLWSASCLAVVFMGIYYFTNNAYSYKTRTDLPLSVSKPENKTLEIKFNRLYLNDQPQTPFPFDNYLLYCSDSIHSDKLYLQPTFEFEKTEQAVPQLILIKEARGFSGITGTYNTENIHYEYKWQNDTLELNNYFTLNKPIIRANQLRIVILVPENYQIHLRHTPWWQICRYPLSIPRNIPQKESPNGITMKLKNGKLTIVS